MFSIRRKISLVLFMMVLMTLFTLGVVFLFQQQLRSQTRIMNVADQQAMLIQQMAATALAISKGYDHGRKDLKEQIISYESTVYVLRNGARDENGRLPAAPEIIQKEIKKQDILWAIFRAKIEDLRETSIFDSEFLNGFFYVDMKHGELMQEVAALKQIYRSTRPAEQVLVHEILDGMSVQIMRISQGCLSVFTDKDSEREDIYTQVLVGDRLMKRLTDHWSRSKRWKSVEEWIFLQGTWEKFRLAALTVATEPRTNAIFDNSLDAILNLKEDLSNINMAISDKYGTLIQHRIEYLKVILLGLALINILFFLIGFRIANRIVRPLLELTEHAIRIGTRRSSEKIQIQTHDEIEILADALNAMVESIKQTSVSRDYFNEIIQSLQECLMVVDSDGAIVKANPALERLTGFSLEELVGYQVTRIINLPDFGKKNGKKETPQMESFIHTRTDRQIPVLLSQRWVTLDDPGQTFMLVVAQDITKRKQMEQKLREMALKDDLTGLYSRRGFNELSDQLMTVAQRKKEGLALVYLDIDGMKRINDELGHQMGDLAIKEVANLIKAVFRKSDVMSRIGGDEFVVLGMGLKPNSESRINKRIKEYLAEFNANPERPFELQVSFGFSFVKRSEDLSFQELLHQADQLMYRAKKKKKDSGQKA